MSLSLFSFLKKKISDSKTITGSGPQRYKFRCHVQGGFTEKYIEFDISSDFCENVNKIFTSTPLLGVVFKSLKGIYYISGNFPVKNSRSDQLCMFSTTHMQFVLQGSSGISCSNSSAKWET